MVCSLTLEGIIYSPKSLKHTSLPMSLTSLRPVFSYAVRQAPGEDGSGAKCRAAVLVCENMHGSDKCGMLLIGKSEKPR